MQHCNLDKDGSYSRTLIMMLELLSFNSVGDLDCPSNSCYLEI